MVSVWKLLQGRGPRKPQDRVPITESKSWRGPQGIASMSPANVPERRETWSRFRGLYKVKKWGCTKLESRAGALGGSAFASMLGLLPKIKEWVRVDVGETS